MAYLDEACLALRGLISVESALVSPQFFTRLEDSTIAHPGRRDGERSSSGTEHWMGLRTRLKQKCPKRPPRLEAAADLGVASRIANNYRASAEAGLAAELEK